MPKNKKKLPLDGIKVLDLSRILAGPWASQILGDLGAKITKIEHLQGDDTRYWGPPFTKKLTKSNHDKNHSSTNSELQQLKNKLQVNSKSKVQNKNSCQQDVSRQDAAYFLCANRNKQSLAIDFSQKQGCEIIKQLAKQSDIIIENFLPGKLAKYGLDYNSLKKINPKIIYCSITGYGQYGDYSQLPGYDFIIQGQTGLMSVTGQDDKLSPPLKTGVAISDLFTGLYAVTSILAALRFAEKYNKGDHLDVALFDCQFAALANQSMNYSVSGQYPKAMGNKHPNIVPYEVFQTLDFPIIIAIGNDKQFNVFCHLIDKKQWGQNSKYKTNQQRVSNRKDLSKAIALEISKKTADIWLDIFHKNNIPSGPVNNIAQAFKEKNVKDRCLLKQKQRQGEEKYSYVNFPVKFLNHQELPFANPPYLGADTLRILQELAYTEDEINNLVENKII